MFESDLMRLAFLLFFSLAMLGLGSWASDISTENKPIAISQFDLVRQVYGRLLPDITPVDYQDHWMLRVDDLTTNRILYNLTSKSGFRWLFFYSVMILWGTAYGLELGHRSLLRAYETLLNVYERLAGWFDVPVQQLYGTVEITARRGVIYMAGVSRVMVEGMEEMGLILRGYQIRVVSI